MTVDELIDKLTELRDDNKCVAKSKIVRLIINGKESPKDYKVSTHIITLRSSNIWLEVIM